MPLLAPLIFSCGINKESYIVEFVSNSTSKVASQIVKHGGTAFEPELPPRDNYIFQGWYYDNRTFEYRFDFSTTICSNLKLYGKWERSYPVTFASTNLDIDKTSVPRYEDLVCNFTFKDGINKDDYSIPIAKEFYTVTIAGKSYNNFTVDTIYSTEDNYTTRLTIKKADIDGPINIQTNAYEKYLTFSSDPSDPGAKVSYECHGSVDTKLEYINENGEWKPWQAGTPLVISEAKPIKVRGMKASLSTDQNNYVTFVSEENKKIKVSGDIDSLIRFGSPTSYCFYNLFQGFPLTTFPVLSSIALSDHCYQGMFSECPHITSTPFLPATNLKDLDRCYGNMFADCPELTSADLPANELAKNAYAQMFKGCSNITSVTVGFGNKGSTTWPSGAPGGNESWLPTLSAGHYAILRWYGTDNIEALTEAGVYGEDKPIPDNWGVECIGG